MRYFIAHILEDYVAIYHSALAGELSTGFGVNASASLFPAHITIKAPFNMDDVTEIKEELKKFASTHYAPSFTIQNFGHFGDKVIFLDVERNCMLSILVWDIQNTIKKVTDLTWEKHEPLEILHVTIAKNFDTKKFDAIWHRLLMKNSPTFKLSFNNVTLLRLEDNAWVVDSVYYLNK